MTYPSWRRGETIIIVERAIAVEGSALDISAVVGLPEMAVCLANRDRSGPEPNAPLAATTSATFEPAAGGEPPRWVFTIPTEAMSPGFYALNSQYNLGTQRVKTPILIFMIEESVV